MKPIFDLARKLTRDPSTISGHDVRSMITAGWNNVALFHIVCIVSLLNFMNHFVEGLRIEASKRQTGKAAEQSLGDDSTPPTDGLSRLSASSKPASLPA
jgi:hypothetical protein